MVRRRPPSRLLRSTRAGVDGDARGGRVQGAQHSVLGGRGVEGVSEAAREEEHDVAARGLVEELGIGGVRPEGAVPGVEEHEEGARLRRAWFGGTKSAVFPRRRRRAGWGTSGGGASWERLRRPHARRAPQASVARTRSPSSHRQHVFARRQGNEQRPRVRRRHDRAIQRHRPLPGARRDPTAPLRPRPHVPPQGRPGARASPAHPRPPAPRRASTSATSSAYRGARLERRLGAAPAVGAKVAVSDRAPERPTPRRWLVTCTHDASAPGEAAW